MHMVVGGILIRLLGSGSGDSAGSTALLAHRITAPPGKSKHAEGDRSGTGSPSDLFIRKGWLWWKQDW